MEITAPAKVNLTLEVLGRRADGYHEIKTALQTIDLYDRLEVEDAPGLTVECDDPSLRGDSNLVWQAAIALAGRAGIHPHARIFLRKVIPVGMGLGGGSSDAVAALLALDRLWGLDMSMEELAGVAAQVGSDVPFFLWGGAAVASGRGEIVQPVPSVPSLPMTLVCPLETIPDKTRRVYSSVTPDHYGSGKRTEELLEILKGGRFVSEMMHNGLEQVCLGVFPGLAELKQAASGAAASVPVLSGAGPAFFCLPTTEVEHGSIADALKPHGARVYRVRTMGPRENTPLY